MDFGGRAVEGLLLRTIHPSTRPSSGPGRHRSRRLHEWSPLCDVGLWTSARNPCHLTNVHAEPSGPATSAYFIGHSTGRDRDARHLSMAIRPCQDGQTSNMMDAMQSAVTSTFTVPFLPVQMLSRAHVCSFLPQRRPPRASGLNERLDCAGE